MARSKAQGKRLLCLKLDVDPDIDIDLDIDIDGGRNHDVAI